MVTKQYSDLKNIVTGIYGLEAGNYKIDVLISLLNAKEQTIFYHKGCLDGFGSRLAASEYLYNQTAKPTITWVEYDYSWQEEYYALYAGKTLVFVDCMVKPDVAERLINSGCKIAILDHHQTAIDLYTGLLPKVQSSPYFVTVLDTNYSGTTITNLAYHYSSKPSFKNLEVPYMFTLIEDMDLWRFNYPDTKWVNRYLSYIGQKEEKWTELKELLQVEATWLINNIYNGNKHEVLEKLYESKKVAETILNYEERMVYDMCKMSRSFEHYGTGVEIVNCSIQMPSQIGDYLINKKNADMVAIHSPKKDNYKDLIVSIRTKSLQANELCQFHGGGGHPQAGAWRIDNYMDLMKKKKYSDVALFIYECYISPWLTQKKLKMLP